jgi:DNA invertase Pin-like site-specific DNA recombinase
MVIIPECVGEIIICVREPQHVAHGALHNYNIRPKNRYLRHTLRLSLQSVGGVAEFERSIIRERQREGISGAKAKGVYRGRKHALTAKQVAQIRQRAEAHEQKAALAREFGISRETLYQALRPEYTS